MSKNIDQKVFHDYTVSSYLFAVWCQFSFSCRGEWFMCFMLYVVNMKTLSLIFLSPASVMFNFPDQATVKRVVYSLPRVGVGTSYGLPQAR